MWFGQGMAKLHRNTAEAFGLNHSNYIGSLVQQNEPRADWATFFLDCRLIPQLEIGVQAGWAHSGLYRRAENLCRTIESEFPLEAPALLHGDLWSGNFLTGPDGLPALVDPAVYYGHREMDLAFSKMFGGFHAEFYDAYQQAWPLAEEFEKRVEIHNLYPLLVHANLFGGHYVQEALGLLARF
jgi:fructosamine-3-kinase